LVLEIRILFANEYGKHHGIGTSDTLSRKVERAF